MAHVLSLGFQIHHYLADWLLRNQRPTSGLKKPPGLDTQPGEIRDNSNSRLCLYWHTLSNWSGADVPSGSLVPRSSGSCLLGPPGEVCVSSGLSFTSQKVGVYGRSGALRSSQISAFSALLLSSLAAQPGSANSPDPIGLSHFWIGGPSRPMFFKGDIFRLLPLSWPCTLMLLVAPLQHCQPWLPMLLGLLVDFPLKVPLLPWHLRQPQWGIFCSHPHQVHLFARSLSGVACESDITWYSKNSPLGCYSRNNLASWIKRSSSVSIFKSSLKTNLLKQYFIS